MEYMDKFYSLVFFIATLLPLFWGFHTFNLNRKSTINRIFLLLNLALSIWSFGFAMANPQTTYLGALFWRRFAAVGWASIFSLILHFFLLITDDKKLKSSKTLWFLHIPSALMVYLFAFSNKLAPSQYNLIQIPSGWTNNVVNNHWDYLYYLFYALYH